MKDMSSVFIILFGLGRLPTPIVDEFEKSGLKLDDLKKRVKEKKAIYNLNVDQKEDKWNSKTDLLAVELSSMPDYLENNYKKYIKWLET